MSAIDPVGYPGQETTTEALGQIWRFPRFGSQIWRPFLQWCATVLPDPIKVATEKVTELAREQMRIRNDSTLSQEERELQIFVNDRMQGAITRIAMEEALSYLSPRSARVGSLMDSPEGKANLWRVLLMTAHPTIDEEDCYWLIQTIDDAEGERIMRVISGKLGPRGNVLAPATSRDTQKPATTGTRQKTPSDDLPRAKNLKSGLASSEELSLIGPPTRPS